MSISRPVVLWKLKKGADKRFRGGHPWVYSNEIEGSPKGHTPGDPVILRTSAGEALACGYGNPHSLIAMRILDRWLGVSPDEATPREPEVFFEAGRVADRLVAAWRLRVQSGYGRFSARAAFGEADAIPGLVMDRFLTEGADGKPAQVLVAQLLTAGIERWLGDTPVPTFEKFVRQACAEGIMDVPWERTSVVLRRDTGVRSMEGLPMVEPQVVHGPAELAKSRIKVMSGHAPSGEPLTFEADLISGQKTGFFLDQSWNVRLLSQMMVPTLAASAGAKEPFRVLDLFCHLGQWGAQGAAAARAAGREAEVTLIDASAQALELAARNVRAAGARQAQAVKLDIVEGLGNWDGRRDFDLVVCDPPAFIKNKKSQPEGRRAYIKVNRAALRRVKPGGWFVSCSCSHHLGETDFDEALGQAAVHEGRTVRWLARGGQAPDHPIRLEFPEGRYLKCWIGRVDA